MRLAISLAIGLAVGLGAAQAEAQSCSVFMTLKAYDAAGKKVQVDYTRGNEKEYFPRPEGGNTDTTKIPKKCSRRITKDAESLLVTPTGGRLKVTQVRSNFDGKMLNDLDDDAWVPAKLEELIAGEATVVGVLRPGRGRNDPVELTTIYLPITEAELKEIARIDAQAEDVEE